MRRGASGRNFFARYKCFSMGCVGLETKNFSSDKIILPQEAFEKISSLQLEFPLFFKLSQSIEKLQRSQKKAKAGTRSRARRVDKAPKSPKDSECSSGQMCGVLEFSAQKGCVYVPAWIMESNQIKEGDIVSVRSMKKPPQGKFCKLRPHDFRLVEILEKRGARYLLESCFRMYSVLQKGKAVVVTHEGKSYWMDVLKTKPSKAISIVGIVDLEVEFAQALNYSEWKKTNDREIENKSVGQLEQELIAKAVAMSQQLANLPVEPPAKEGWSGHEGSGVSKTDRKTSPNDQIRSARDGKNPDDDIQGAWDRPNQSSKPEADWKKSKGHIFSGPSQSLTSFTFKNKSDENSDSKVAGDESKLPSSGILCTNCGKRIPKV